MTMARYLVPLFGKGGWWWWSLPYTLLPLLGKGSGGGDYIHTHAFLFWERDGVRVTMVRYPLPLPKTEDGWLRLLGKGRFGDHLHAHSFLFWGV